MNLGAVVCPHLLSSLVQALHLCLNDTTLAIVEKLYLLELRQQTTLLALQLRDGVVLFIL